MGVIIFISLVWAAMAADPSPALVTVEKGSMLVVEADGAFVRGLDEVLLDSGQTVYLPSRAKVRVMKDGEAWMLPGPCFTDSESLENSLLGYHPALFTDGIELVQQGVLLGRQGEIGRGIEIASRGVATIEVGLTRNNRWLGPATIALADLYQAGGRTAEAESAYRHVVELQDALSRPVPTVAFQAQVQLALLAASRNDIEVAQQARDRALVIFEEDRTNLESPRALTLLSQIQGMIGERELAEDLARQALALVHEGDAMDGLTTTFYTNNLAMALQVQGKHQEARQQFLEAAAASERDPRSTDRERGVTLSNLAISELALGDLAAARTSSAASIEALEANGNPLELNGAYLLQAITCWSLQETDCAVQALAAAGAQRELLLTQYLRRGTAEQRMSAMDSARFETDILLGVATTAAVPSPERDGLALSTMARHKGRALEVHRSLTGTLRQWQDADLSEQLRQLQARRAEAAFAGQATDSLDASIQEIEVQATASALAAPLIQTLANLRRGRASAMLAGSMDQAEALAASISKTEAALSQLDTPQEPMVEVSSLANALPEGAALLEIVAYRSLTPKVTIELLTRSASSPPQERYLGFLLLPDGTVRWADLGQLDEVNAQAAEIRRSIAAGGLSSEVARALHERILGPFLPSLEGVRHLLVSPDHQLNLLPFGLLVTSDGHYLLQERTISFLGASRDLLRPHDPEREHGPPVIVAAPSFGAGNRRTAGMGPWPALPGAETEARELEPLLPGAIVLTAESASEQGVSALASPSILHVASHGFFLSSLPGEESGTRGVRLLTGPAIGPEPTTSLVDPSIRSGLVLAGANDEPEGAYDGYLTALEVLDLDLVGTELVVLSACDTGVGEASTGHSVAGLRRALVLAGSESQVLSLWKVSDAATAALMVSFYTKMAAGESRVEALRAAQLELQHSERWSEPRYWAGFVLSGSWEPLTLW